MSKPCQNLPLRPFMIALSVFSLSATNAMEKNLPHHEGAVNVRIRYIEEWGLGETFFFFPPLDIIIDTFKKNHDSPGGLESSSSGVITHIDHEKVNFKCLLSSYQRYAIFSEKWKSWGFQTILDYLLPMSTNYRESKLSSNLPLLYPAIYREYGGGILSVYPFVDSTKFIRIALPLGSCEKKVDEFSYGYFVKKGTDLYSKDAPFLISHRDFGKKTLKMILLMKGTEEWKIPREIYQYFYNIFDSLHKDNDSPQNRFYAFTSHMGPIKEVRQRIKDHNNKYFQRSLPVNK